MQLAEKPQDTKDGSVVDSELRFPHGSVSGSFGDPDPCLPSARRPRPLEISEGPIRMGHKVQGSPSELSTAPTAHEASKTAAFRKHRASSASSSRIRGGQEDVGPVGGLQERLNVLLELAGRPGWTGMLPQDSLGANIINRKHLSAAMEASIEELETDLLQVTGRARRLWKAVESTSSSSASALVAPIEQEEPLQASQEEELLERIACLDHDLKHAESKAADERRKSTRLRARIARMRQDS
eukprot:s6168_g1.t1